jgi:hypothetical protein
MTYLPGDRVRWSCEGDDGFPLVRYGFIGADPMPTGQVQVVFDDELGGQIVPMLNLEPVTIGSVELCLHGGDLVEDPALRQGLVRLWQAEAESAGLDVRGLRGLGTGLRDSSCSWALAEIANGTGTYVVRAWQNLNEPSMIRVRADRHPSR